MGGVKRVKLSQYARDNGLTYHGAYKLFKRGSLKGIQLDTGTILIDVGADEGIDPERARVAVTYARVSSSENKDNLKSQSERLRDFAAARGLEIHKEVLETGSGLNDTRPKLARLFDDASWGVLIVEHKDRLTRHGFSYLERLAHEQEREIIVINNTSLNTEDDLMQDFVSLVTSYCARLYGLRRSKRATERIISEALNE